MSTRSKSGTDDKTRMSYSSQRGTTTIAKTSKILQTEGLRGSQAAAMLITESE